MTSQDSRSFLDSRLGAINPFPLHFNILVYSEGQFSHLPCNGVHIHPQLPLHKGNKRKVNNEKLKRFYCPGLICRPNFSSLQKYQQEKTIFSMSLASNIFPNYLTSIYSPFDLGTSH